MTPNIVIALSLHKSEIKIQSAVSLAAVCATIAAQGLDCEIRRHSSAEVIRNRNILASAVLANPERTHLLFMDVELEFRPETLLRMLTLNKPVVGCIYPAGRPAASVRDFVVDIGDQTELKVSNGAVQVRGVGMGLCLIQRTVLDRLAASGQVRADTSIPDTETVYGFFDSIAPSVSEGFSFCRRWASVCGGEVWALVDEEIGHIGEAVYKARFLDHVRTNAPR